MNSQSGSSNFMCYLKIMIFFLVPVFTFSQTTINPNGLLREKYESFFSSEREKAYLDIGKTIYTIGEDVWFSGFVFNLKKSIPYKKTANLEVGLYDEKGHVLEKKIVYTSEGIANGYFTLKKEYGTGIFYIKASTHWMNNFSKKLPFVHRIFVMDRSFDPNITIGEQDEDEITITPEGGNLISDIENNVAFKVPAEKLEEGPSSLFVSNNLGETIIENIKPDQNGLGKFKLIPKSGETYYLNYVKKNGTTLTESLPKSMENGVSVEINNLLQDRVVILLRANQYQNKNTSYTMAIHRDGMMKLVPFHFEEGDVQFSIKREDLLEDINIVTIFDTNQNPLAERLFLNNPQETTSSQETFNITLVKKTTDSVYVQLDSPDDNLQKALSISIMPEEANHFNFSKSIVQTLKIEPYVGMDFPLPNWLVHNDRGTLYELDVLLTLAGKSYYDWDTILKGKIEEKYKFETGFDINGKILNHVVPKDKTVNLYQKSQGQILSGPLEKDSGTFNIEDAFLVRGDSINIILTYNGKQKTPEFSLNISPMIRLDTLSLENKKSIILEEMFIDSLSEAYYPNERIISLEDVTVTGNREKKVQLTRNPDLVGGSFETRKIGVEEVKRSKKLSDYIRRLGFKTYKNAMDNSFFIAAKIPLNKPPVVFIDGFRSSGYVQDYGLESIDEVYFEHTGLSGSNGGTLYIYTRTGDLVGFGGNVISKTCDTGYSMTKEYFNTRLEDFADSRFIHFGQIHWAPASYGSKSLSIAFPHYGLDGAIVVIEGIATNGKLYSQKKYVSFN